MSTKAGKIVCNISNTQYPLIAEIVKCDLNWRISEDDSEEWDVMWTDSSVPTERLNKMKHYQRINHFPGMYLLSRKNFLALNLKKLQKLFPDDYFFFPKTWNFPCELSEIKSFKAKNTYFIVKPEASSQGKGIFLTTKPEELNQNERFVVQEYIVNPYLIDGFKFDLRIYVLVTSCEPLRIFVYEDGLARLASEEYCKPNRKNAEKVFMHLTNYAINKNNKKFVNNKELGNDNLGHKRSLKAVWEYLLNDGCDLERLLMEIDEIIVKTLCCAQPNLSHHYLACQPEDLAKAMCFEILGFDIILDENKKPYLLEVNHSPSFNIDSPLDRYTKKNLIIDSLKLAWVSRKSKLDYLKKSKDDLNKRVLSNKIEKSTKEEKKSLSDFFQHLRNKHESKNLGKFRKIYPVEGHERFEKFLIAAKRDWLTSTGSRRSSSIVRVHHNMMKVKSSSCKKMNQVNRNVSFTFIESSENSVFNRLSQPIKRKPNIEAKKILPGIVYEDKQHCKYELPRQIVINLEKTQGQKLQKSFKNLGKIEKFKRTDYWKEFSKTYSIVKCKAIN